jgi:nephrocystin-3
VFIYDNCQDLIWCVDEDFPAGTELTALQREREAHQAFADARCRVYIGSEDYFTRIEEHTNSHDRKPMVILGESGMFFIY